MHHANTDRIPMRIWVSPAVYKNMRKKNGNTRNDIPAIGAPQYPKKYTVADEQFRCQCKTVRRL